MAKEYFLESSGDLWNDFQEGEWLTSHPGTSRNMELTEGSLDAGGHVGGGKTREGCRRKGDAGPGVRVTSGRLAG